MRAKSLLILLVSFCAVQAHEAKPVFRAKIPLGPTTTKIVIPDPEYIVYTVSAAPGHFTG